MLEEAAKENILRGCVLDLFLQLSTLGGQDFWLRLAQGLPAGWFFGRMPEARSELAPRWDDSSILDISHRFVGPTEPGVG